MLDSVISNPAGNPYHRPRPSPVEIIAGGKFYLANENGGYGLKTTSVNLALSRDCLWINDALSIPLSSITDTGITKHGGYIRFWDAIDNVEIDFNFTKLGFLRFKRKKVEAFLAIVSNYLPANFQASEVEAVMAINLEDSINCEVCGSTDAYVFILSFFRFVGIAPIAYSYSLTPFRYVLCAEHARSRVIKCSIRTALTGYLGFPGFIAAPWYICKNLWALHRLQILDYRTLLWSIIGCVILPCAVILTAIWLLIQSLE